MLGHQAPEGTWPGQQSRSGASHWPAAPNAPRGHTGKFSGEEEQHCHCCSEEPVSEWHKTEIENRDHCNWTDLKQKPSSHSLRHKVLYPGCLLVIKRARLGLGGCRPRQDRPRRANISLFLEACQEAIQTESSNIQVCLL